MQEIDTPPAEVAALGLYWVVFSLAYNRSSVSTSYNLRINKIFKFSFLKSIKKAQSIIERQQEMNITVTQTFTERLL